MQITYKNKVTLQSNPNIPDENKVTAENMNEIKSVVNSNEEEQQALTLSVQEIAQNVVNNSQEISNIKEEQTIQNNRLSSLESDNTENKANIQENANNINQLSRRVQTNETNIASLQLESGNTLELSLNNTTYELTATLKNKAGTTLSTSKVDFPVEQLVISVTYDSAKKELVITLKNGQITRVPIGSIINGLVNQSDFDALVQTVQTKANQSDLNQTNTNVTNLAGRVSNNESKIENLEQEQTTQNTNISNNATNIESLQEENENLKKIVSQLPQVTGQGTEVTLEDTIEAPFTKFDVEGNSTQESTEGRNYLPQAEIKSVTSNGVTITSYADGKFTIKGTPTAEFFANFNFPTFDVPANAYFHLRNTGNASYSYALKILYGSTEKGAYAFPSNNKIWQMNNEAYSANLFQFFCNSNAVGTAIDITLQPSIELTDAVTDFEKYTNGASPNPNYEQPIYSAGDNGSINEKIQTRNLWSSVWEQGYINANGVNENNSDFIRTKDYIYFEPEQKYAIKRSIATAYTNVRGYDKNKRFVGTGSNVIVSYSGGADNPMQATIQTCVIATKPGVYYLKFNDASNNLSTEYMMVKGDTPEDYVPHEEQDYSIFVQQPFRSNKDKTIKDKFVIKSDNKKYERHWIGEVVLNGTEEVYLYNDNGSRAVFYINVADLYDYTNSAETPELLSNRFRPVSQTATWEPGGIACRIGGRAIFFIFKTGTSVNEFKNWLSTHNVVVQYLLAEPLDLPCTPEQVEQLENKPSTYKDFTIIQSEDETPAYLEVAGIYDLNKLITRTEVLESEV